MPLSGCCLGVFAGMHSVEYAVYGVIHASLHYYTLKLSGNCMNFQSRNISALKPEGIYFVCIFPFLPLVFNWKKKKKKEKIACGQIHTPPHDIKRMITG